MNELNFAIEIQKIKKSTGPEAIYEEFIKHLGKEALHSLLTLYNLSWISYVAAVWQKSIIIPIAKEDKPLEEPDSYRPISLNSILAMIMPIMVNERLVFYLEHHKLLTGTHSGFRIHPSTSQQVARLSQAIKDNLDRRETLMTQSLLISKMLTIAFE